jgi:hypothetical protein
MCPHRKFQVRQVLQATNSVAAITGAKSLILHAAWGFNAGFDAGWEARYARRFVPQGLPILFDRRWVGREASPRAAAPAATSAAASAALTTAALAAAPRLATAALARTARLTATTTARAPTRARGAGRNATGGVADQFSVGCSEREESHEHCQGDHGDQERILRNVVPGLLAPKTL